MKSVASFAASNCGIIVPHQCGSEVQDGSLPAGSFHKKRVVKRPGYMRTELLQQIGFQPLSDCEPFSPKGLEHNGRKHYREFKNCFLKRRCKNDTLHCNACVNSPSVSPDVATGSPTAGNKADSLRPLADFRVQQSEDLIQPVCPVVAIYKRDLLPASSSSSQQTNLLDSVKETAFAGGTQEKERMHALDQKEENNNQESESKDMPCTSFSPQDHFNSSFSFIQLSLNSACETNGIGGPVYCREPKEAWQTCKTGRAENVTLHVPWEGQRTSGKELWASSISLCSKDHKCPRGTAEDDKVQDCESHSLSHSHAAFSCSTESLEAASAGSSVTSGYESSNTVSDHSWDSLMKKYEPVLQDCLLGNQSILKIKSLIRKLQRLQAKAVAEDDYERADKFRRKLEELEKEKSALKFQLPSQHPSISSFLERFKAQVQVALYGEVPREEKQLLQRCEQKILNFPHHGRLLISATKRDQLLEEKALIQKEIEILRARLAVLEAKDQQLRREIQDQDQFIQMQDCELSTLLSWVSLGELQEIGEALTETSKASQNIPCTLDLPESLKRLQEKEQSLNMSIKHTAARVCTSQKLCSTLRRKVNDIETQLPTLLEAKMLAVSGGNFCTARDLVEEIKSLTAERERLEGLLNEWFTLSAKNVQKLERMKEGYKRLKEEMAQGESAFEKKLKEDILRYMEVLEEKLQSCGSQLLERVWEVDLEACQLLIRGFQLKEGGCCVSEGEESQTDEVEDTADASLSTNQEQSKHFPVQDSKWSTLQCPVIQSKHQSTHWELKEEFHILTAELDDKCEKISEKLMHLEDQLQTALCGCDEDLVQSLQREIQMVKETLQAMLVQLQPAKKAEEDAAVDFLGGSWCPGKEGLEE
ncbi:disrupted in schizophrenia 1 protein isoform X2 [Podarcis raffonei]|uniref:disrupted in schizophrenia 1 protein isoform X2 n=1 Tax=Podarcis raffonei TaxID=65483 RepID=UPI0023292D31|nr:disrupted in schizophrenia 1 protein isoform X2 [Podarcis raffonei]